MSRFEFNGLYSILGISTFESQPCSILAFYRYVASIIYFRYNTDIVLGINNDIINLKTTLSGHSLIQTYNRISNSLGLSIGIHKGQIINIDSLINRILATRYFFIFLTCGFCLVFCVIYCLNTNSAIRVVRGHLDLSVRIYHNTNLTRYNIYSLAIIQSGLNLARFGIYQTFDEFIGILRIVIQEETFLIFTSEISTRLFVVIKNLSLVLS